MVSLKSGVGVSALALCLSACGSDRSELERPEPAVDSQYLEGVPEQAALQLAITEDVGAEALASEDEAIGDVASEALGSVELALDADSTAYSLGRARDAVRDLNRGLRNFLGPIAAVVRNVEPDEVEANVAMWGPVTRGATQFRVFVRRGALRRYGWLLQARPDGSSDGYSNVAAGGIQLGALARRGRGTLGVDLDAFGDVDPTVAARGKILAGFAHGPRGTVLRYGLRDFSKGDETATPIDAAFQGVHLTGGYNRVRLAFHGNLPETDTDAEELVLARVRHHRGEGGRADLLVTGGDIPDGQVWVVSECWNSALGSGYRIVLECPGDGPGGEQCVPRSTTGEPGACLGDLASAELPPSDPEAPMEDAESPDADVTVPESLPTGEAPAE